MDNKTRVEIETFLTGERERLLEEIAEFERSGQETLSDVSGENNYRDHMADQGSATFARELDQTLEGNARERLGQVDQALGRIAAGDHGVCKRCGKRIPLERLKAMPTAELCVTCKEWEESQ
ncbi:MAG: conjugal transfer protein TraR [Coriobacteriaceae bacterium]|nr:conjugal transfer protein TraR [Coriobacteriaceae bacterium]